MSQNKNASAPATDSDSTEQQRRPFDGVMIALSAALLIIFGIVIGRFIVTSQAVEVVDHFDAELSTRRAELVELNRQLIQSEARQAALEEASQRYRELATSQQIRADRLAARQQTINTLLSGLTDQREACLDEIRQYVALDQPVPAGEVLHFAEALFDAQTAVLDQWNDTTTPQSPATATVPQLPAFPQLAQPSPSLTQVNASRPSLVAPTTSHRAGTNEQSNAGVYFAPPRRQRPLQSVRYFCPQRSPQMLTLPDKPGITFHDTASDDSEVVRR